MIHILYLTCLVSAVDSASTQICLAWKQNVNSWMRDYQGIQGCEPDAKSQQTFWKKVIGNYCTSIVFMKKGMCDCNYNLHI